MVSIRDDNVGDIFKYTTFELIEVLWCLVYKTKNDHNYKYCCWKDRLIEMLICAVLEKKWSKDLQNLPFVLKDHCQDLNPLIYFDKELFIEKLMKMKKELKKKNVIRRKSHKKIYGTAKPLRF